MISPKEDNLRQNLGLAAIFGNDSAYELLQKRIAENADIGVTIVQPTEHEDEFNEILAAAYAALMQMPVKPETYEEYAAAECAEGGKFDD
jgi:hypothetical protein